MSGESNRDRIAKTAAQKIGVRPNVRCYHHDVPEPVLRRMRLPALDISPTLEGSFEYIHAFMTTQLQMRTHLPSLRDSLDPGGSLWLSWPKTGQLDTDLSPTEVIRIGYDTRLVESKCISIDAVWSALKFTHPIAGKSYRNSYGRLPDR